MFKINPLYEIILFGRFPAEKIHATFNTEEKIDFSVDEQNILEKIWEAEAKSSPKLYNGPLARLLKYSIEQNNLGLSLGYTNFKEYIGTNEEFGNVIDSPIRSNHFSNPLAVASVTKTIDQKIILEIRSNSVLKQSQGKYHVKPSGHMVSTLKKYLNNMNGLFDYSIYDAVMAELYEELAVEKTEIKSCICTGLIKTFRNRKPELTFLIETKSTSEEILSRPKEHDWESTSLELVTYDENTIMDLLTTQAFNFVEPGHAALLLAGFRDFSHAWQELILEELNKIRGISVTST